MSEPTVRGSPPPPPLLPVLPVVSLLLPQPATASDVSARRKTANMAVSRVDLIEILRSSWTDGIGIQAEPFQAKISSPDPAAAGLQTLATLSEVTGGRNDARATSQQTLWGPVRQHRRVDRQHAAC